MVKQTEAAEFMRSIQKDVERRIGDVIVALLKNTVPQIELGLQVLTNVLVSNCVLHKIPLEKLQDIVARTYAVTQAYVDSGATQGASEGTPEAPKDVTEALAEGAPEGLRIIKP